MKTYWFSSSPGRIILNLLRTFLIGIGVGILFESVIIGGLTILLFPFIDLGVSKFKKRNEYNQFLKFVRKFGENYDSKEMSEETYDLSVLGDIPYEKLKITFGSFVNEEGIVIFYRRSFKLIPEYRFIGWTKIVGIKSKNYLNQKTKEINYLNFERENRLLVPWREEFDKYVPIL